MSELIRMQAQQTKLSPTVLANRSMLQRAAVNSMLVHQAPPIVHEVLRSSAQPLDPVTRAFMEPRFGYDFSQVRVHTGTQAAESAQLVSALAYTVGRNIVFGANQYTPHQFAGQRLIAHELVHVTQQAGSAASGSLRIGDPNDYAEQAAERISRQVVWNRYSSPGISALMPAAEGLTSAPVLRRQPAPGQKTSARPDPSPGLGPTRAEEVDDLIRANDHQGAIDTLVHFKYMDYEFDYDLVKNRKIVYDPSLASSDGTTSMPNWDHIANRAEPPTVRIGPGAFSSVQYLYSVIMHEYQHVLYQQTLPQQTRSRQAHSQGVTSPDEVRAGAWELLHGRETGIARLPDKVAQIWENLNEFFWGLDSQDQAIEKPLVTRAYQSAQNFTKGSKMPLVPFAPPSSVNP